MSIQAPWDEMRQKMQVVKDAYVSRHYTQCAKFGERLLAEVQGEIHPIHLAYLNFYTALSHDTLAREATLKNRYNELNLAEKHYLAAIAALTPLENTDRSLASPTSSTCSQSPSANVIWKFRRARSVDSTASFSSTNTSSSTCSSRSGLDSTHGNVTCYSSPSPSAHSHSRNRSTIVPSRPQTPEEYQFAGDTAAFIRMVRAHLADVRILQQATTTSPVRLRSNTQLPSPAKAHAGTNVFDDDDHVRKARMNRTWRRRFDPEETQRLCAQALAELGT